VSERPKERASKARVGETQPWVQIPPPPPSACNISVIGVGMKILVTGAAGFLGSHLCDRLLQEGHDVIGVDNLFTGSKANLHGALRSDRFTFLIHDVTMPLYLEIDGIFNLACPASPLHYQKNPVQTLKTSVHGVINMLGLAKRTKARFLQASTSEVYGDPEVSPQKEDYWGNVNPTGIRSCYDEGKRAAESLTMDYRRQYGVDARIARIFNTYGPRMATNDGRVVSNFIVQALNGDSITIYGDGSQTRSFCYFEDLIEGLLKLFFADAIDGPVNLGNPEEVSILDLAYEVVQMTKSPSQIIKQELPLDDPKQRLPDIRRAQEILGWNPKVPRHMGLLKTIEFFLENLPERRMRDLNPR
jgi:UDP-glucuronate decarboxylase